MNTTSIREELSEIIEAANFAAQVIPKKAAATPATAYKWLLAHPKDAAECALWGLFIAMKFRDAKRLRRAKK